MSAPIIEVHNLGKCYRLQHHSKERYSTFRDVLMSRAKRLFLSERPSVRESSEEDFWAVQDVSFQVNQGEVVGIIGRNGAGKSTLLRLLSRITEPTRGRIALRGRVASLLEVGTGFHPELTGRENIYLNGAILGMSKTEIRSKFDEIVAFAEVERFLDTPVKRYSSGMYVRLAFAVAAHLEPEILIVDEVLAVGDAEFQKKCLGKMQNVAATEGRTILFVSHHMPSVQRLCSHCILLGEGRIKDHGATDTIVQAYMGTASTAHGSVNLAELPSHRRRGNGVAQFNHIELLTTDGRVSSEFRQGEPFKVRLGIISQRQLDNVLFGFSFISLDGVEIMGTAAHDGGLPGNLASGKSVFECHVDPMILSPGRYSIRGAIFRPGETMDHIDEMLNFDVSDVSWDLQASPSNHRVGHVYLPYTWTEME